MIELLPDRWTERDFPLLMAVARRLDAGEHVVQVSALVDELELELPVALRSARTLLGTYVTGRSVDSMSGPLDAIISDLTERGRRATGLWPSGESADALVEALRQAEEATDDPEEKGNLRRAAGAVMGVGRDVMTDVMASVISKQMGGA
ncbi:hypothetical protein M3C61_06935 [Dermacoccus abyssi]|jgi:hypothetical protein|uniref:hypothetical protein n=1 Tax=Dermacoccus abyssi TaxID=322596 RepID=UPI0021A4525C|nr:hypothetical protein [Dermacoccus abyssi]MCT1986753.1 hypothetical protein [Dermacoccus abyssi]